MFIVILTYKVPLEEIEAHLENHIIYLKEQYKAGNFLASGRKVPRSGGVILAKTAEKSELELILTQDPFNQNNLADYEIIEFIPSMTCKELDFLIEH
uniref:YciI family protein n=1 Tax=uncultured Dysgonomonas sp. TaxID=206096 RepID=UPI00261FB487|nr:YciI family protein [uncultured Dysgonomonas sp.]